MAENNRSKEIVAQFWQNLVAPEDDGALAKLLTADFILYDLTIGEKIPADKLRSGLDQGMQTGSVSIIEQYAAEENHLVTRFTVSGAGSATINAIAISRMQDEQIAECTLVWAQSETKIEWRWPPW